MTCNRYRIINYMGNDRPLHTITPHVHWPRVGWVVARPRVCAWGPRQHFTPPIDIVLHLRLCYGNRMESRWELAIFIGLAMVISLLGIPWLAGRWLRKRRERDEPWLAQTELWDRLDGLVSEAEEDGCRIWNEGGEIRFGGDVLTQRASAILTVLEKHHADTLIVLSNRKHG